jgi:hypothetical protein
VSASTDEQVRQGSQTHWRTRVEIIYFVNEIAGKIRQNLAAILQNASQLIQ